MFSGLNRIVALLLIVCALIIYIFIYLFFICSVWSKFINMSSKTKQLLLDSLLQEVTAVASILVRVFPTSLVPLNQSHLLIWTVQFFQTKDKL